jgi:hypothetical protein
MIRKCLFLLALSAASQTAATAAIDLTPTPAEYTAEGITIQQIIFTDGKRRVSYEPPRQWTYRGDASRLQFTPPEQSFAEGVIQTAPAMGAKAFDEATVKALEAQVMNTLPPGSHGVTVISRQSNPVILNQNMSYEFVVAYQTLGQTFHRSVIFVNCPDTQLVFRFTAPKAVFDNLNNAFRRSIYSWQWSEPGATAAGPVTASK